MTMKTTAKDIMTRELIVAKEGMKVEEALKLLMKHKVTGMPVVDHDGKVLGILSEYDIIANVAQEDRLEPKFFEKNIEYTKTVASVVEDASLSEVLDHFINKKIRRLPVLDKCNRLVGLISRRDIMRVLYYRAKVGE